MIGRNEAEKFAKEWIQAWNSHDLEAILAHYSENIVFFSPFVKKLLGEGSGRLLGKEALRNYFARGLAAYPELRFELREVFLGMGALILRYRSVGGLEAAEYMALGEGAQVVEARAHYDNL